MTNVQPAFHVRAIDLLQRARDIHRETCILARGEVRPTAYRCGMCEVLNPPAAAPAVVEPPADDPMFGGDGCTCIPFTRQTNPPRRLKPTDTVDMISGWERGQDCPHHAPAVPSSDQTTLRDRLAEILRAHANLGGAPLKYALPFFDGATPSLPRISGWKPLDDVVDDLAAAVLPEPAGLAAVEAERDALGREADRLRKDWVQMRIRAEQAEAEVERLRAGRAAALREAALHLYTALFPAVYDDMGQKGAEGVNRAVSELRRMADETATTETGCWCGHPEDRHWTGATAMTFTDGCHDCRGWNGAHVYGQELPWLPEGDEPATERQDGATP